MDLASQQHKLLSRTESADTEELGTPRTPRTPDASSSGDLGGCLGDKPPTELPLSIQQTLAMLDQCGLQRLRTTFIRERISFDTLDTLVEDGEKMEALGMRYGEQLKLRIALKPKTRPTRRNSFDEWLDDGAGKRVDDAIASQEFILTEFAGFRDSGMITDANEIELGSFIADGTTGGVYKGMWRGMVCAVKRFRYSKDDATLVQTFKNEVFLLRNLVHENLVTFYGACAVPPNLCILTELMTGSLQSLLYGRQCAHADGSRRQLNEKRQAHIIKGVAMGCAFLHSHSVAHRDLKSANVLYDRNLNVKLCDFAFSKFRQHLSNMMESQVGTPAWMAPEVLRGETYTHEADVYSFGVIIWEIVHRCEPLKGLHQFAVAIQVGVEGRRLGIGPECPMPWRDLMERCFAEPAQRPSFAAIEGEAAAAKRHILGGSTLAALRILPHNLPPPAKKFPLPAPVPDPAPAVAPAPETKPESSPGPASVPEPEPEPLPESVPEPAAERAAEPAAEPARVIGLTGVVGDFTGWGVQSDIAPPATVVEVMQPKPEPEHVDGGSNDFNGTVSNVSTRPMPRHEERGPAVLLGGARRGCQIFGCCASRPREMSQAEPSPRGAHGA
jgi:serine/threonine protein kinase